MLTEDRFPEHKIVVGEPIEEKTPDDVTEDDVPDMNAVFRVCWHFWQMPPVDVCGQLGYKTVLAAASAGINPWEAFLTIKGTKKE